MLTPTPEPAPRPAQPSPPGAALLGQVADLLTWPLMAIQPDGRLLLANHAARRLLQEGQPIRLRANRSLTLSTDEQQIEFEQALRNVAAGASPVLLRWAQPGADRSTAETATLSLLRPPSVDDAGCLLLAIASVRGRVAESLAFARLHGLSAAETRVLQRLTQGETSNSVAQALNVSNATVRSQILSLRRKAGVSSLADLLGALGRMPPLAATGLPMAWRGAELE